MSYIKDNFVEITNNTAMNANAFASTFYFLAHTQGNAEKNKKSLQANAPDSAGFVLTSTSRALNVECFGQTVSELQTVVP